MTFGLSYGKVLKLRVREIGIPFSINKYEGHYSKIRDVVRT